MNDKMKKCLLIKILFLFVVLILSSCNKNKSLQIVKNGVSNYEIVLLGNEAESQYKSSELLKTYIDKIMHALHYMLFRC